MIRELRAIAMGLLVGGAACAGSVPTELGNVMFVGDSITHGFGAPSYRWALHKILVDNGVRYTAVGVSRGNQRASSGIAPGTPYAGVPFTNVHSSRSSERAYEVAGRKNCSGRLGDSNIFDWLGLDSTYTGEYRINPATQMPDVFILLIGTNDLLAECESAGGVGRPEVYRKALNALLGPDGDMDTIVSAMRQANPAARILVLTVPTWHDGTRISNTAADYASAAAYNEELKQWGQKQGVTVVDVNRGLVDVARTDLPGVGAEPLFNAQDHLHPSLQGDLLIAAEVAQALGVSGRTVGLERKCAAEFPLVGNRRNAIPPQEWAAMAVSAGLTVSVTAPSVGNGSADGWAEAKGMRLHVCRPDMEILGKLTVKENGIFWNEQTLLYSADMAQNTDELRVAWVPGNAAENRPQGFYVWLGERLIGEALPSMPLSVNGWINGAMLSVPRDMPCNFGELRAAAGAYAPCK